MGSRAAAPKGTMSCRTQGDFCSFVRLLYDGLRTDLRPEEAEPDNNNLKPQRDGFRLEMANLKLKRAEWRPERVDLRTEG